MNYIEELKRYCPQNEQEEADRETILAYIRAFPDTVLTRENIFGHMTASSMIFNKSSDKVLMIFHNIFRSWGWTGGHADGETDLFQTALREAREETGIRTLTRIGEGLASVDVIPVWGHVKKGRYVSAHQHLNFTYLLRADEQEALRIKADENSRVGWLSVNRLQELVSEPDMLPIYEKLIGRERIWK